MNYSKRTVIALAVVAIVLFSAIPMAETDADDTTGSYGTTFGIELSDIDEFLVHLTGRTLDELAEYMLKELTGHDVSLNLGLRSKFALTRDIVNGTDVIDMEDRLAGYFALYTSISAEGIFPAAGTYEIRDGETPFDFIKRVFTTEATEQHAIDLDLDLTLTFDLDIDTKIDPATGEVDSVYISIFPMIMMNAYGNISLEMDSDDDGNLTSITIGYERSKKESNFYADFQIELTVDDLKVLGEGTWECNPVITEHVVKSIVSKDMAGGVWNIIASKAEGLKIPIVDLLLDIIGSSDKKLDLFKTIESLMNNPIPDITFVADATINDTTDEHGDRYVVINILRDGGSTKITLPMANYKVKTSDILDLIPKSILDDDDRIVIDLALTILGWDYFEVDDISEDPAMQQEISGIHEMVDYYNEWNENYKFELPGVYLVTAIVVAVIAIIATALMWRGRI